MVQDYSYLLKKVREMRRDYKNLDIDSKLKLLNLEMKIEAKYIMPNICHTKNEKSKEKEKKAEIRKHNEKNKIQDK